MWKLFFTSVALGVRLAFSSLASDRWCQLIDLSSAAFLNLFLALGTYTNLSNVHQATISLKELTWIDSGECNVIKLYTRCNYYFYYVVLLSLILSNLLLMQWEKIIKSAHTSYYIKCVNREKFTIINNRNFINNYNMYIYSIHCSCIRPEFSFIQTI